MTRVFALALVLSVVGLALGPALVALGRGRTLVTAAVEGLTLGVVPLLVIVRLIPHVMEELGPLALGVVAAGYGGLWLIDRRQHELGDRVGIAVLIPTLAAHALADGAGLGIAFAASREQGAAGMLIGLAIVVHRMPEGLLIATRFVPVVGWSKTLLWLALLAGATLFGALAGDALLEHVPDTLFDVVVAVGLGAMLRMVVHAHGPQTLTRGAKAASGLAFIIGTAVALAIPSHENLLEIAQPGELPIERSVVRLFALTAPAFLIGLALTGGARALAPGGVSDALKRGSGFAQALRGAAMGGLASVAARLVPSAFVGLLEAGAPASAAVAFALAATSLDLAGAAVSVPLFGAPFAIARFAAAGIIAVALAVLVARAAGGKRPAPVETANPVVLHSNSMDNAREAVTSALHHSGAWYLAGLILAGALEAFVPPDLLAGLGGVSGSSLGALWGMVVFIPAYGAAPIGAVLIHKGVSPGAVLAFLIAASGHGHAKASAIRSRLGSRAAGVFTAGTIVCSALAGTLADAWLGGAVPDFHAILDRDPGLFGWGSAAVLGVLLMVSVVRFGPREWLSSIARAPRLFTRPAEVGHKDHHADHAH